MLEKHDLFKKWCWKTGYPHEDDCTKINSTCIKGFNVGPEILKFLEKKFKNHLKM
jgi:hypothetical protein